MRTPLEMPHKSNASLKWRALEKTLQAWNKLGSDSQLHFGTLDKVRVVTRVSVAARLFLLSLLATFLTWSKMSQEKPNSPAGSTFSHIPLKRTCRASKTDNYQPLLHTMLTSEEHQYSCFPQMLSCGRRDFLEEAKLLLAKKQHRNTAQVTIFTPTTRSPADVSLWLHDITFLI